VKIYMYGKKGCGKCDNAEKKLSKVFEVPYRKIDLEDVNPPPADWKECGMAKAMALYSDTETLPVIGIDLEDGGGIAVLTYPAAMKMLKRILK